MPMFPGKVGQVAAMRECDMLTALKWLDPDVFRNALVVETVAEANALNERDQRAVRALLGIGHDRELVARTDSP